MPNTFSFIKGTISLKLLLNKFQRLMKNLTKNVKENSNTMITYDLYKRIKIHSFCINDSD